MLVYTSGQTATSRYLSLSQALKTKRLDSSLLRGSRGGSAASHGIAKVRTKGFSLPQSFVAAKRRCSKAKPLRGSRGGYRRRARRLSRRGQGSRECVQFTSVATPYQNVCAAHTLICFSCARRARFMRRRRASCAEGTLHLRHACAVILSFPPAQSGSGDTGKADRAAVKIPPSTPPAEQSPCRKTAPALDNHRSQK